MLRLKARCRASASFSNGAATIGTPNPITSQSSPTTNVSAMPLAHLLIVLNVAGATITASMWQAFYQPWITRPHAENKIVPGNADFLPGRLQEPTDPRATALHRAARYKDLPEGWMDIPTRNGNRKDTLCLREWTAAERSGKQCDEYPFATTHEGAASAGNNVSVKPVDKLHNRDAGNDLNFFYERFRILDGDKFWVRVK